MTKKIKVILLGSLILFTILLIYLYIASDKKESIDENKKLVSKEEFVSGVDSIILSFGIKKEWQKNTVVKNSGKSKDTIKDLLISKNVLIPNDLPIIELNHDISNYATDNKFSVRVSEDQRTKNVAMNIFTGSDSAKRIIGNINFIYSDSIRRDAGLVCVILDSIDAYSISDAESFLNSTLEYSVILPLRNDKADYQSAIIESKRDYLLLFSVGSEDDIEADFRDDMKESLWRSKVKSISLNFPAASGIIFMGNSGSPDFENTIMNEFEKNNLRVFTDTIFFKRTPGSDKVGSLTASITTSADKGNKTIIYRVNLNPQEFKMLDDKISVLKKKGYKFFTFNDLFTRISRQNISTDSVTTKK